MDQMPGIIRIGKESFAAGLFWQPAPTAAMAVREARIVAAKVELAADLFCVRKRGAPQFGLGQRKVGHKVGMRAIAPALASSIPEATWVGAFPTDREWLYVMVRKGAVMPDGDVLFKTEQEARQRLRSELSMGDWDIVFAPPHWQMEASRADDLIDLISSQSDARLRPVVRNPLVSLFVFCTVVGVGLGIKMVFFPPVPEVPFVPNIPVVPPPPPLPWQGQPSVRAVILACEHAIEASQLLPGFEIEAVSCGPTGTTTSYRRRWGSVTWLPKNSLVSSPDRASVITPLADSLARRSGEEQPATLDSLRRMVWGAAQTYLLDSEFNEQAQPGSTLFANRVAANVENSQFRAINLSLGGRMPPSALAEVFGRIPACVIEEVSWQTAGWRVRGKAYVR